MSKHFATWKRKYNGCANQRDWTIYFTHLPSDAFAVPLCRHLQIIPSIAQKEYQAANVTQWDYCKRLNCPRPKMIFQPTSVDTELWDHMVLFTHAFSMIFWKNHVSSLCNSSQALANECTHMKFKNYAIYQHPNMLLNWSVPHMWEHILYSLPFRISNWLALHKFSILSETAART